MQNTRKITDSLLWVGADDRRLALFEGVYSVPEGVSYNAYLLLDEKTVLFDTVDKAVRERFMENLAHGLGGRPLDYFVLHHVEPDHTAAVGAILKEYPEVTLVLNTKSAAFLGQFFDIKAAKTMIVAENDSLPTGKHNLVFVMAPMVHWPEVMMTYESTTKTLFSADAFGNFGALNGALFADEVDFGRDYIDKTRRYYSNIVGKYGAQVQQVLKKMSALDIETICPLHGFVFRKNLSEIIHLHTLWSSYEPEEQGVLIAYASVYGNTENAAEILSASLRELGVKTVMYDVSVTPPSYIVAEAFRWSHLVFASTTYNAGIFVTMEALIYDLVHHNIQNRTVALIENGSWAATSSKLMRSQLEKCKDMRFLGDVSIKSSVKPDKKAEIDALAKKIADTLEAKPKPVQTSLAAGTDPSCMFKIPYGLYLVTAHENGKDNGMIVNTVNQVTVSPLAISVNINKQSLTHDMIRSTGRLAVSVLSESAPFWLFENFGFASGRDTDKFAQKKLESVQFAQAENGLKCLMSHASAVYAGTVVASLDAGTHTVFLAEIEQAQSVSGEPSVTYSYYFANIKPKPAPRPSKTEKTVWVCKICNFEYEGEVLPGDYICPLCKHGASDFVKA